MTIRKIIYILIIIGFVLYFNSFGNQMFWDDDDSILKNAFIQNWEHIPKYFSENLIAGAGLVSNYWRPVLLSVFSLEWHLWEDWAPGYHFVNTSFHIANAILLFLILLFLFKEKWLSFLTSLIFLAHPLQTEAVTYVAGLGDSLSVFFVFLGIWFYLKSKEKKKLYKWSLIMYALALMSKETAIIMPGFIFLIDFVVYKKKIKESLKTLWPFLAIFGFYFLLRATVLNFSNTFNLYGEENIFTSSIFTRIFTFLKILTIYIQLLFWPFGLHMERSVEIATSLFSAPVLIGLLVFLSLITLAVTQLKKRPIISFGILWFFIGLSLTSNILIPINGLLYEHWLYLPLIGIFLPLIWLGQKIKFKKVALACFVIFFLFLSTLTMARNRDWKDPITFYNQTLEYAPDSFRVINNLGMAYNDVGDHEKAEETYFKAIALNPSVPTVYHNLGNNYANNNQIDLAIENFEKALELNPHFTFSYGSLFNLYLETEQYDKAIEVLQRYSQFINSNDPNIPILIQEVEKLK